MEIKTRIMCFEVSKFLRKIVYSINFLNVWLNSSATPASMWLLFLAHEYAQIKPASIVFQKKEGWKERRLLEYSMNPGFKQNKIWWTKSKIISLVLVINVLCIHSGKGWPPLRMPDEYLNIWMKSSCILTENNSPLNEIAKNLYLTFF